MKKLILLLLFIPLVSLGQEKDIDLNVLVGKWRWIRYVSTRQNRFKFCYNEYH